MDGIQIFISPLGKYYVCHICEYTDFWEERDEFWRKYICTSTSQLFLRRFNKIHADYAVLFII